jgi:hypothetical protein
MLTYAVSGGSYTTLARSHIRIEDSCLHNYARIRRSYTPGISWLGVGHYVGSHTLTHAVRRMLTYADVC